MAASEALVVIEFALKLESLRDIGRLVADDALGLLDWAEWHLGRESGISGFVCVGWALTGSMSNKSLRQGRE